MAVFNVFSYNLHGFTQGGDYLKELLQSDLYEVGFIQEHWLLPQYIDDLSSINTKYTCFAKSSMSDAIGRGLLKGRPYGGIAVYIKDCYLGITKCVSKKDRYIIISVGDMYLVNVYMPTCREKWSYNAELADLLSQISNDLEGGQFNKLIMGGDFNFQLSGSHTGLKLFKQFMRDHGLSDCDRFIKGGDVYTYFHEGLNAKSFIDHFLVNDALSDSVVSCDILESGCNLSDHLPIVLTVNVHLEIGMRDVIESVRLSGRLRWDKANVSYYYDKTYVGLVMLKIQLSQLNRDTERDCNYIETLCSRLVDVLVNAAESTIPRTSCNFYKHWWDTGLSDLKMKSVEAHNLWVAAGKPGNDSFYHMQRVAKLQYKKAVRDNRENAGKHIGFKLEHNLLCKDINSFWKTWNSKFNGRKSAVKCVNGNVEHKGIANAFADHFSKNAVSLMKDNGESFNRFISLHDDYMANNSNGIPVVNITMLDACLRSMKLGKAAGVDGLEVEHLLYAHPIVLELVVDLFNSMFHNGYVPDSFARGIIIPVIKDKLGSEDDVNNYRAITLSSCISKLFEMCLAQLMSDYLYTSDLQFGFKKGIGCRDVIFTLQSVVSYYVKHGSTVNICMLDMSKAFDKINHYVLFTKLMQRGVPGVFITLIMNWYSKCSASVRWVNSLSYWFNLSCGVRQGGIFISEPIYSVC